MSVLVKLRLTSANKMCSRHEEARGMLIQSAEMPIQSYVIHAAVL